MIIILLIITIIAILLYSVYISENKKSTYWSSKGAPQVKHKWFFGILWDYIFEEGSLGDVYEKIYSQFPHAPYVGAYLAKRPNLILRDPKLIQHVLRTEFQSFLSRGINANWEVDKLADNILFMEGVRWKIMRQKLTPVFTSGKLRNMFSTMEKAARDFEDLVDYMHTENQSMINIISTFTTSLIGASVFGIDTRPSVHFDSPLQEMARDANNPNFIANLKFGLNSFFPKLFQWTRLKIFGHHEGFFINVVKHVLRAREKEGIKRHDFIDTCLEIQKEGKLQDISSGYEIEPTDELMAAQAFFFFIAGVDPTATAMHFTLFELSRNPEILERLLKEIDALFSECAENITYDDVNNMSYLDKVLNESLRMYPPIGHIQRKCVIDNILPDGTKINKEVMVTIPVQAIHRDAAYYPNPNIFDPERFSSDAEKERPNYTFLPFGEGNRICIGMRFARLQAKTGLLHLLRRCTVRSTTGEAGEAARGGWGGGEGWSKFEKSFFNSRASNLDYQLFNVVEQYKEDPGMAPSFLVVLWADIITVGVVLAIMSGFHKKNKENIPLKGKQIITPLQMNHKFRGNFTVVFVVLFEFAIKCTK